MNDQIAAIVDALFQNTVINEETLALHEELMNNCQEHYADLVARGETPEDALEIINDSLNGMKEVIAEYPRREEPDTAAAEAEEAPEEGHWVFSGAEGIRVHLRDQDIEVLPSTDGRIHLRCDQPDRISWTQEGGWLQVTGNDRFRRAAELVREEEKPSDFSLDGILNYVGRVVSVFSRQMSGGGPLKIAVPGGMVREMDLNTNSGDISCQGPIIETLRTHTTSGEIEIDPSDDATMSLVTAGSASGDIRIRCSAAEADLNTISGDVYTDGAFDTVRMKSVSGDAEFRGSVITLSIQSVSGDAEAEIENTSVTGVEAHSTSGDLTIVLPEHTDAVHAECSSRSGDCVNRISDAGSSARVQIRAATVSGDVTIETR